MTSVTVAPFSTDCPAIGKVLITIPGVILSLADNSWHQNPDRYRDDHDDSRAFVDQRPCWRRGADHPAWRCCLARLLLTLRPETSPVQRGCCACPRLTHDRRYGHPGWHLDLGREDREPGKE